MVGNRKGPGNLLNKLRGYRDEGMICTVALVSILVAVPLYWLTYLMDRLTAAKR